MRVGALAWVVVGAVAVLAVCGAQTAGAVTTVSGDRDSNAPLIIDPSTSPTDAFTRQTALGAETMFFIQRMPVTKRINSLTLGDIGRAAGCTGGEVAAQIHEHEGGAWSGATNTRFYATAFAPLPATPGKVTWAFPPTTLREGRAYSLHVQAFGCGAIKQTMWEHNAAQVDGGPLTCEQGPTDKRMWHYAGLDDAPWACVSRTEPTRKFKPDMPEGWLVSRLGGSTWDIMGGSYANTTLPTSSACGYSSSRNPSLLGASWSYWRPRPDLPSTHSEFVCKWSQFGPPGDQLEHGWYYALPWLTEKVGEPRDMYLKLETIDYDALLEEYSPVLKFDTESNYWNASPQTMVDWPENKLRFINPVSTPCASFSYFAHPAQGGTGWGLDTLVEPSDTYPGTACSSSEGDVIDAEGDHKEAADSYRYGELDNHAYGRVVHDVDGDIWLQYWFFYYFNEQNLLGIGQHEGDWEMVQYQLAPSLVPDTATYSQHQDSAAEACAWSKVATYPLEEGGQVVREAPVVYVAAASQASYYVGGTHVRSGRPDDSADGLGEIRNTGAGLVSLAGLPTWALWPGHWGDGGPVSPGQSDTRWNHPQQFHDGAGLCSNPDGSPR